MIVVLVRKIVSLFIIMLLGVILVKGRLLCAEDSKPLSVCLLYVMTPCMLVQAFQIECTDTVRRNLVLTMMAAVTIHVVLLLLGKLLQVALRLDPVEYISVLYSNAGNMIIPLVMAVLGWEWVIYCSAYIVVQQVLLWSHAQSILCGYNKISVRKMLSNVNIIATIVGMVMFFSGFRFPELVQDALTSVGGMLGGTAMLATGMLIGGMKWRQLLAFRRVWLVALLRLLVIPALIILLLKYTMLHFLTPQSGQLLLISALAASGPTANAVTMMSQIFGKDASYAAAINVVTTLGCIVTLPLMALLFQW